LESGKLFAENVEGKDIYGWSALHHAVWLDLPKIAKTLIEAKVNLNATTENGNTSLHFAAKCYSLEIGRMLIEAGANVNVKSNWQETPLDIAINDLQYDLYKNENAEFIEMLNKV
jgi:ankyrin repeat protein